MTSLLARSTMPFSSLEWAVVIIWSTLANLQYAGIVFSALFGLFLFGDQIPFIGWAGMCLIVLSGIAATALRDRSLNKVPAEEH